MSDAKAPEGYDPHAYNPIGLTVDLVCLTIRNGKLSVLLVERGEDPFAGTWALPGGFVKNGNTGPHTDDNGEYEDAPTAAYRELAEETGVNVGVEAVEQVKAALAANRPPLFTTAAAGTSESVVAALCAAGVEAMTIRAAALVHGSVDAACSLARSKGVTLVADRADEFGSQKGWVSGELTIPLYLEQLGTYTSPFRDPRMRVASVAYLTFAPNLPEPQAGSDANDARWWTIEDIEDPNTGVQLAFDHALILANGIERLRSKIEYTTLATQFLTEPFTIGELRNVYEAIWGSAPNQSNFWRKVLKTEGFVVPVEGKVSQTAGGPRAQLYKRGKALAVQPPMMRPTAGEDDDEAVR